MCVCVYVWVRVYTCIRMHMNFIVRLQIYEEGIYQLSVLCAQEAARRGVRCYVEVSNAQLLSLEKVCVGGGERGGE